jgi:hypothetical protein
VKPPLSGTLIRTNGAEIRFFPVPVLSAFSLRSERVNGAFAKALVLDLGYSFSLVIPKSVKTIEDGFSPGNETLGSVAFEAHSGLLRIEEEGFEDDKLKNEILLLWMFVLGMPLACFNRIQTPLGRFLIDPKPPIRLPTSRQAPLCHSPSGLRQKRKAHPRGRFGQLLWISWLSEFCGPRLPMGFSEKASLVWEGQSFELRKDKSGVEGQNEGKEISFSLPLVATICSFLCHLSQLFSQFKTLIPSPANSNMR